MVIEPVEILKYLFKSGILKLNLSVIVPSVRRRQPVPSVYTKSETGQLLSIIDTERNPGKRDYAIILLALMLGIRSGDIVDLKIPAIDFQSNMIEFAQSKTVVPQRMELLPELKNAIQTYLSGNRPDTTCQNLFITHRPPYRPLSVSAVTALITRYNELATEMNGYLNLVSDTGRGIEHINSLFKSLDQYLNEHHHADKSLPEEVVSAWMATRQVKSCTKAGNISCINGFAQYLVSLGFEACVPEPPKVSHDYVPYVFSEEEWMRIVSAADNSYSGLRPDRSSQIFPVLLRILYGCGLRVSEGLSIRWTDIDLETGVITVREGKKWFSKILKKSNICYSRKNRYDRGPCPHSLRHTFVLRSFLKSESEGRKFEDTSPFLSAYLGHESLSETDKYLNASHLVYADSHKRVNDYIGNLIPEVFFDED